MRNDLETQPANDYKPFPREALDQSIGARFDEIVRRFPNKLAVRTKKYSWSYAELNARAENISQAINEHEISRPAPILLVSDHDAPAIAALLGVLKAGHFYCALDPAAPLEHNKSILQSLSPRALLCDGANLHLSEKLAEGMMPIMNTDDAPVTPSHGAWPIQVPPDALAYVFFTSGTTGKPKGVMDSHRNVLHNILRYSNNLRITGADRITLLQMLSFSGSVSSLFCALLNGGTVYPFDLRRDGPGALADLLSEQGVTIYHSVPSIFRLIAGEGRRFPSLRIVRLEGDQASAADAALFQRNFPASCRLVNGLGATECGIIRQFFLSTDAPPPGRSLPIGYPVEDMEVFLLDHGGRMTPTGEIGEIAVKSRYLATGYWRQPARTIEAFKAALDDPAARIYRTGDLGRFDEAGCLDYLGRKDFQNKVRGQSVNLAEIEAEFLRIDGTREAVAVIRPNRDGENQIAIFYTSSDNQPLNLEAARTYLHNRLDSYAMPSLLIRLDRLPLNTNGKVDRGALPHPRKMRLLAAAAIPPSNATERRLVTIWQDVLGLEQIGVDDSFLELGGDSLQIMRMLNRVRELFERNVAIAEFFVSPKVSALARILDGNALNKIRRDS